MRAIFHPRVNADVVEIMTSYERVATPELADAFYQEFRHSAEEDGNGRHARLMADLLVMQLGGERLTWGSATIQQAGEVRRRYIDGLKAADNHDLAALLAFARS